MTRWLVAVFLLAIAARGRAEDPPQPWTEGTRLFHIAREKLKNGQPSRADFRAAAAQFANAVQSARAESFLNLGNAYYLAGELPEAIAAFNAGLAADPSDSRLHENLALARREVSLPSHANLLRPSGTWQRLLFQNWLNGVAASALFAASLILPASLRLGWRRWTAVGLGLSAIAIVGGVAIVLRVGYLDDIDRRPVCVLRIDTPLRVGNADRYPGHPDTPLLPRGYEVRRLDKRGGWLHVECPGGTIGWVPEVDVVRLAGS